MAAEVSLCVEVQGDDIVVSLPRHELRGDVLQSNGLPSATSHLDRAKAVVDRYDRAMMRGHEGSGVVLFRRA
jgi:hypothetical protein